MIGAKEPYAGVYNNSIIDFVMVIITLIIYADIFCDQHREVIHDQTCKNLLYHAVLLFRMKSNKTDMVTSIP